MNESTKQHKISSIIERIRSEHKDPSREDSVRYSHTSQMKITLEDVFEDDPVHRLGEEQALTWQWTTIARIADELKEDERFHSAFKFLISEAVLFHITQKGLTVREKLIAVAMNIMYLYFVEMKQDLTDAHDAHLRLFGMNIPKLRFFLSFFLEDQVIDMLMEEKDITTELKAQ